MSTSGVQLPIDDDPIGRHQFYATVAVRVDEASKDIDGVGKKVIEINGEFSLVKDQVNRIQGTVETLVKSSDGIKTQNNEIEKKHGALDTKVTRAETTVSTLIKGAAFIWLMLGGVLTWYVKNAVSSANTYIDRQQSIEKKVEMLETATRNLDATTGKVDSATRRISEVQRQLDDLDSRLSVKPKK